jgi:hypothetical protein
MEEVPEWKEDRSERNWAELELGFNLKQNDNVRAYKEIKISRNALIHHLDRQIDDVSAVSSKEHDIETY